MAKKKDRNTQAKENYAKLRKAGLSAADARKQRYAKPEKLKQILYDIRQEKARVNYANMREAGFNSKDARRYRYSTPEKVKQVIKDKVLPPVEPKKQGAKKLKTKTFKYDSSTLKEVYIEKYTQLMEGKVWSQVEKAKTEGYKYMNVAIEYTYATGQQQMYSTDLMPINDVKDIEFLNELIEEASNEISEYYSPLGVELPQIKIIIRFWKPIPIKERAKKRKSKIDGV